MVKRLKPDEKFALSEWEEFVKSVERETTVDESLSYSEREEKRKKLEADPIAWMLEMFPNYAKYPFAPFHKKAIKRIIDNPDWYEVLSWSRELSKSTITMMIVLYLALTGKKKNIILASDTNGNAVRLLNPYRANLEGNQRIKFYYGDQVGIKWKEDDFISRNGVAFRGLGAGQQPRGSKNENIRPDLIIPDDFDTDEECRNIEIINNKWNWFEQALYFTRSMSEPLTTIWCGNIIAEDCCITRAGKKAVELSKLPKPLGNWDIKNLRMVNINKPDPVNDFLYGKSVWPEKNTEEKIDTVQAQVSADSVQKECYNNPITKGEVFKPITWGKVPSLHKFKFLVAYGDPAPSDSQSKSGSFKGVWLVGKLESKYYVIYGFLDKALNSDFVTWYPKILNYVGGKVHTFSYIECNSLQKPFHDQVYKPLFKQLPGGNPGIIEDDRDKKDKYTRIEGGLELIIRNGELIFNEDERENPHFKELETEAKLFGPKLKYPADGLDCIEGAKWIIDQREKAIAPDTFSFGQHHRNPKRY